MRTSKLPIMQRTFWLILATFLTMGVIANPANALTFYSTTDPSHWTVATNVTTTDVNNISMFPTSGFQTAVAVTSRPDFIANNSTGTNGSCPGCKWVYFVFNQTFDLTGFDPTTADLKFQWAADDSGQGFANRGNWTPKFSLNGGALIPYPGSPTATYSYSSVVDLSSGFVSGLNTIKFYVEGNSVTDGFELKTVGFTADPTNSVPEPSTMLLVGAGLAGVGIMRRRFKR